MSKTPSQIANTPAFPTPDSGVTCKEGSGLTFRQLAAIHAMQGLLANSDYAHSFHVAESNQLATHAVAVADQLAIALAKTNPPTP